MKKFAFTLEKVADYKTQILDNLLNEHGAILFEIRQQEEKINGLKDQYTQWVRHLTEQQKSGTTVSMIYSYENYLEVLDYRIREENKLLGVMQQQEELKRRQVLEARQETASLEKMREKRLEEYEKQVRKEEEKLIDEFVSNSRIKSF